MERISFLLRVKEGQQDEYIRRHKDVWPDVLEEHTRAGIKKMSIFLKGRDLFLYMEVENYAKAVEILGSSPATIRWEEYMAPIMESATADDAPYDPLNAFPGSLPEVFYWESSSNGSVSRLPSSSGNHSPQPAPVKS